METAFSGSLWTALWDKVEGNKKHIHAHLAQNQLLCDYFFNKHSSGKAAQIKHRKIVFLKTAESENASAAQPT